MMGLRRVASLAGSALISVAGPGAALATAQALDTIDVSMNVDVFTPPVVGLDNVELVFDLGGAPNGSGNNPPPVDTDNPPLIQTGFCLYVPPNGLRITITGQNADGGTGFFIESDTGLKISYVVEFTFNSPPFQDLGPFDSGVPKIIPQTEATDQQGCNEGDNVSFDLDFANVGASTDFKIVVDDELTPAAIYTFSDLLTLTIEQDVPNGG